MTRERGKESWDIRSLRETIAKEMYVEESNCAELNIIHQRHHSLRRLRINLTKLTQTLTSLNLNIHPRKAT